MQRPRTSTPPRGFVSILMWKNALMLKKSPRRILFAVLFPMVVIVFLGHMKQYSATIHVPDGWATDDDNDQARHSLFERHGQSSPTYYTSESTASALLLTLSTKGWSDRMHAANMSDTANATCLRAAFAGNVSGDASSPFAWPQICRDFIVPSKLAIVPDTAFTREYFARNLAAWYPRVQLTVDASFVVPSFHDSIVFFADDSALEAYIMDASYGTGVAKPRIFAAIVFSATPAEAGDAGDINYAIRMDARATPKTTDQGIRPFQRSIDMTSIKEYATSGFQTLQTLVARFAACMPHPVTSKCTLLPRGAPSNETDELLFHQIEIDPMLAKVATAYSKGLHVGDFDIAHVPPTSRSSLLVPLYHAPHALGGASTFPLPIHGYTWSPFYETVQMLLGLLFLFAYMQMLAAVLVGLVGEKESKARELLKILGVPDLAIVASWLFTFGLMSCVSATVSAVAAATVLFPSSSVIVLFVFFLLTGSTVASFGYAISAIFSKSRLAIQVGTFAYFLSFSLTSQLVAATSTPAQKALACIVPAGAMNLAVTMLAAAEASAVGIPLSNLWQPVDNFCFGSVLLFMVGQCVGYILLGCYFEKVVPKDVGVVEPWYFLFRPSYWGFNWSAQQQGGGAETEALLRGMEVESGYSDTIEPVGADLRRQEASGDALQIHRLRKVFSTPSGPKVAVDGLNLTLYKNQITCLLGHNGAGKTTLIHMLTGMIPPTSGDATVHGLHLTTDLNAIRASVGMCPQHNILYNELTVAEHLRFYGRIKGFTNVADLNEEVTKKLHEVGLTSKRDALTTELSGGMKRKLSLAIALLGNSTLVFLDEPTSGMDPYSRRSMWDVILNNRPNRIVVLTTHFMDEADVLGDRIAIMAEGELRCAGSSLFLKNRYGAGYTLSLVRDTSQSDGDNANRTSAIKALITSFVDRAKVLSDVGSEMAFQLPLDESHVFGDLFQALDKHLATLRVLSYGISVTTLEEVFLKVAEVGDVHHQHTVPSSLSAAANGHPETFGETQSLTPSTSASPSRQGMFWTQFRALLVKRFRIARRDRRVVLFGILAPIAYIFFGIRSLAPTFRPSTPPAVPLTTASFPLASQTPVGGLCESDWFCDLVNQLPHAVGYNLSFIPPPPVYPSTSPTVFNVTYDRIDPSGPTGFCLRLGEALWESSPVGAYGAYVFLGKRSSGLFGYNVAVNTTNIYASAIYKAMADSAVYSRVSGGHSLNVAVAPFPPTHTDQVGVSVAASFLAAIFIVVAFAQYSPAIVPGLVHEKHPAHNSKHQQLVSGASLTAFWFANYVFDVILIAIPSTAALVLIYTSDIHELTGGSACTSCSPHVFEAVIALFVAFGAAMVPYCYLLSHLFTEPSSAHTASVFLNMLLGLAIVITSMILDSIPSMMELNGSYLKYVWRLSPLFNLGNSLLKLCMQAVLNGALTASIFSMFVPIPDAFSYDVIGIDLTYLAVEGVIYFVLAVAIDYLRTFPSLVALLRGQGVSPDNDSGAVPDIDGDVAAEARRVTMGNANDDAIVLNNLRKVYGGKVVAVDKLSLGLPIGECFGYLGINGAGKTTTMQMLTGNIAPTSGRGTLGGYDVLSQQLDARRLIGYCPQFDALLDLLTVREHLELFAAIKGLQGAELEREVLSAMSNLNLDDFEHKLANALSGGTKRKLSVAIAMIGAPPIIFLDEPSTGMDPVSRRFMWNVIANVSTKRRASTIVLTTHSMEECEALCTRVGIMVDGRLRCLGSIQHLKHKFGDGLVLHVKLASVAPEDIDLMVEREFCGDATRTLAAAQVMERCEALGLPGRADLVTASHPTGYVLAEALKQPPNAVLAPDFCAWWLAESHFDALEAQLRATFGVDIQVLERQQDMARFKLRGAPALASVFTSIEAIKEKLHVQEYTVSQTTLEQIFNSFASKQQH
ncbi:hypothetical protein H310_10092 [Aphanomyces invadans]|uniref:ABC transporter domain-containing protein n=1 Tax=Aphanomyces invadans TaxID=157072 RepID=A0A024TRY6_9STRA|nr:hypothetical protein H310_10092 [Aphanomyces invadans]ETV96788.1 hypothetical protein H310_10092 [Aphanomyces invadans]|eukprot:XP_008874565.1 hypothetical protein H310_10092 [Aphanomyces invadans]